METVTPVKASTPGHFRDAARLILDYKAYMLSIDCLDCGGEDIDEEVKDLPSRFPAQEGGIFLVYEGDAPLGCVAVMRFEEGVGEIRRMYVAAAARGKNLGTHLMKAAIAEARALGYRRLLLDTFRKLPYARRVYESLGFREIPPYTSLPAEKLVFMALELGT